MSRQKWQKYRPEYTRTYEYTSPSLKGEHHARCTLCVADFSIKHSGSFDITRHQLTKKHKDIVSLKKTHRDVSKPFTDNSKAVIRAECYMSLFLIEHNLAISCSDHLSDLFGKMFPMCIAAKNFKSKRTKTTFIIKEMGKDVTQVLVAKLKKTTFSVLTDGSADKGGKRQLYPLLVRYYDEDLGKIVTYVLQIPDMKKDSTGQNIFDLLDEALSTFGLRWDQVVSFCSDNAAVMMGRNKGVAGFILKENPKCFMSGCTCHLIAIAARNASKQLPISVEAICIIPIFIKRGA